MLPATGSDVDYTMALAMSTIKQSSLTPLP
jgi:hypothetical protein